MALISVLVFTENKIHSVSISSEGVICLALYYFRTVDPKIHSPQADCCTICWSFITFMSCSLISGSWLRLSKVKRKINVIQYDLEQLEIS